MQKTFPGYAHLADKHLVVAFMPVSLTSRVCLDSLFLRVKRELDLLR